MKKGVKKGTPRANPTEKQLKFVEATLSGLGVAAAAAAAGAKNGSDMMTSATIKAQLESARRWLTDITQIKRLDVIEGIMDGIEMARMMGDPGNVIKGWSEVAKILGYYAPEVKKIELSLTMQGTRSKLEALSDEELLQISQGAVIEGEVVRVN